MLRTNRFVGGHCQVCSVCSKECYTRPSLRKHIRITHQCLICGLCNIINKQLHNCPARQLAGGGAPLNLLPYSTTPYVQVSTGLTGTSRKYHRRHFTDPPVIHKFYEAIYIDLEEFLKKLVNDKDNYPDGLKLTLVLRVLLKNLNTSHYSAFPLAGNVKLILDESDIFPNVLASVEEQVERLDLFQTNGSRWAIVKIKVLEVSIDKPQYIRSGYYIPTPRCYSDKRGLINLKTNHTNQCFQYCAIAKYMGYTNVREASSLDQYEQFQQDNPDLINFSCFDRRGVCNAQMRRFEKLNPEFSVNIYHHDPDRSKIYPVVLTKREKLYHMDLLRVFNKKGKSHFILISNFSGFMREPFDSHKLHYCRTCLQRFLNKKRCRKHSKVCSIVHKTSISFPKQKNKDYSKFFQHESPKMYVVADFETFNEEDEDDDDVQNLIPAGFAYAAICGGASVKHNTYVGQNPEKKFIKEMLKCGNEYRKHVSVYAETMKMTAADWITFNSAINCCLCGGKFLIHLYFTFFHYIILISFHYRPA